MKKNRIALLIIVLGILLLAVAGFLNLNRPVKENLKVGAPSQEEISAGWLTSQMEDLTNNLLAEIQKEQLIFGNEEEEKDLITLENINEEIIHSVDENEI